MDVKSPKLARLLATYASSTRGSSAAEYALMLMVLAGCAIVALHALGHRMDHIFESVAGSLSANNSAP